MRLPSHVRRTPEPASLVCPDCGGALAVQAEGDAGEVRLEEVLWSGVDLLADLVARGGPDGSHPEWPAARLRERLNDNEPIDLGEGVASKRDTA
jgi:hypothetical protein